MFGRAQQADDDGRQFDCHWQPADEIAIDVINGASVGFLDDDLAGAARRALAIAPALCCDYALQFSWRHSAEQFLANLKPFA